METKKALITGITGQDGSYLAEFLIEKGYEIHGIVRRGSTINTVRIDDLLSKGKIHLHYGDLGDANSIVSILMKVRPDEIYNLGSMSHVRVSFDVPEYTGQITGLGALRILEALRSLNMTNVKYYQASSSEMFGLSQPPQNEETPFRPQSPYGCAKLYAYWITKAYRTAYNMFACNGILFNHECVSENTPVIVRDKNIKAISIKRIQDIRNPREKGRNIQQWVFNNIEIWDGGKFTELKCLTATRRKKNIDDFHCKIINSRHGIIESTNHHNMLDINQAKIKTRDVEEGSKLWHGVFPAGETISYVSEAEAMFLGLMVGDGYISEDGRKGQFSNNDEKLTEILRALWMKIALGTITIREFKTEYGKIRQARLNGNSDYLKLIRKEIYTKDGFKKVPDRILNTDRKRQLAFLRGYNITDGLQSNRCIYEFKGFKTNSIILAQGLLFLISQTTKQDFNITFEEDEKNYGYYSINFLSPVDNLLKEEKIKELMKIGLGQREISRKTGISRTFIRKVQQGGTAQFIHHLSKEKKEVKKTIYHLQQPEWVFDLETDSGRFMGGIGNIITANSPRRGETFVTKKIVRSAVKIKLGLQDKIHLGNLKAKRDWGFAGDYVEAIYKIMQHNKPDDFVVATKEHHTIEEFAKMVFKKLELDLDKYLEIDDQYFRPNEVPDLMGDATKIRTMLGWEPKVKFEELIDMMIKQVLKEENVKLKGNS